MTCSPMPTSLEEAKKEILMWRELHRSKAAQPAQHTAAIKTLEHLGYTYHGAEYWKPPLGKRPAQPEGWKLVPVEPTNEMNCAGNAYAELTANQPKGMWWWGRVYQAMLTAAPSTKEPEQPVGINGLTDAETSASMSVVGLSKPKVAQPVIAPVAKHVDGRWCEDLYCNKCYSAEFRFKHATPSTKEGV